MIFHVAARELETEQVCLSMQSNFNKIVFVIKLIFLVPSSKEIMNELTRREKEGKIIPDPDVDTYMKVVSGS